MKNLYTFLFAVCVAFAGLASQAKAESFGFPSYGQSFGSSCSSCGGMGIGSSYYNPSTVVAVKVTVAPIYAQPMPYYPAQYPYYGGGACGGSHGCSGGGYGYGGYPVYGYPMPYYPGYRTCGVYGGYCRRRSSGFVAVSWGWGSVAVGW